MTTKINLLPWRDEQRKQRNQVFYGILGAAAAVGVLGVGIMHFHFEGEIDYQQRRNAYLEDEIAKLERQIVKIRELESTKEKLIARMNVIQELQQGRPQIVHLFHQFVKTLPEGLYLNTITEKGGNLQITGVAESNARVSSYMENLEASNWMANPDLNVINVEESEGLRISDFKLTVKESNEKQQAENKAGGDA